MLDGDLRPHLNELLLLADELVQDDTLEVTEETTSEEASNGMSMSISDCGSVVSLVGVALDRSFADYFRVVLV